MTVQTSLLQCSGVHPLRLPKIGVMARPRVLDGVFQGKQGPVLHRYLEVARREGALACVFDPAAVDVVRHRVCGFVLESVGQRSQPKVEKTELGVPPVIYDQIVSRRYERSEACREMRDYLQQAAVVFNGGYFDKWEVTSWLGSDPRLRAFLPRTALITGPQVLHQFSKHHQTVFIKPIHGSLGVGILRISRDQNGFCATLRTKRGLAEEFHADGMNGIYRRYRARIMGTPHIVQEGVPLVQWGRRPFDVRVLMQKDRSGVWKRTKVYMRIAAEGEFISNLTAGGEACPLSALSEIDQPLKTARIGRQIRALAATIPAVVEDGSQRLLGELGIDLGIAENGRIYIIEVNSKPWKTPATLHGSSELVDLSFLRPIRFALTLAGSRQA
ncbi:MAG: YheC/YheD family endospore coat-associated protein [Bacilli bacterium]